MGSVVRMFGRVTDGLRNLASGLGVAGSDKQTAAHYVFDTLSRQEIDACYRTTWLGRKIHDIPAKDMTREWRCWQADDQQIEAIEKEEKRLQLRSRVRKALVLARLYGGSAIVMGLPGEPDQPAPPTISAGDLRWIHVLHRWELTFDEMVLDPRDNDLFGKPKMFRISSGLEGQGLGVDIHPSRVVSFFGNDVPDGSQWGDSQGWYWGDPLLMSVKDAISAHDTSTQAITALLQEAKVDVVHIPGLMDMIADAKQEEALIQRINLAAVIKSITNTLILDGGDGTADNSGEKWEVRNQTFTGMPDLQRVMFQLVSGAADIPATRLIGESPRGMNATGESDTRNYYDRISSEQESDLTPALNPLDEYLIMSATGARDPSIYYEWHPLWQMDPKETAERDWLLAQSTEKFANLGVIPNDAFAVAVQNRLIENATYPGLEAALEESQLEADILAPPPPLPPALDPNAPPAPANDPNAPPMTGNSARRAANDRARKHIRRAAMDRLPIGDSMPRPLYVSRKVLNGEEIAAWARGQGVKDVLAPADMHVTIIASRDPVDWMQIGGDGGFSGNDGTLEVPPGGPRVIEPLGQALVLMFNNWELTYRHGTMREAGASWDFADYQPHISISYDRQANDGLDLAAIQPFTGAIRLGPEIFEEFKDNALADA